MMKSRKKVLGLVILLLGVVVFVFAKYQHREGDDKSSINIETNTQNRPVDNTATLEIKGSDEHSHHKLGEVVGIILIIAGAGLLYFNRKKHH